MRWKKSIKCFNCSFIIQMNCHPTICTVIPFHTNYHSLFTSNFTLLFDYYLSISAETEKRTKITSLSIQFLMSLWNIGEIWNVLLSNAAIKHLLTSITRISHSQLYWCDVLFNCTNRNNMDDLHDHNYILSD